MKDHCSNFISSVYDHFWHGGGDGNVWLKYFANLFSRNFTMLAIETGIVFNGYTV